MPNINPSELEYEIEYDNEYDINSELKSPMNLNVCSHINKEYFEYEWE